MSSPSGASSDSDSGMDERGEGISDNKGHGCCGWWPFRGCSSSSLKTCLRPLSRQNVLHWYCPLLGSLSYTALSVHIVKPSLSQRIVAGLDPTNVLLAGSLAGTCLWVYDRKAFKGFPTGRERIVYSIYTAGLFNLGSLLIWAMIRAATSGKDKGTQATRLLLAVGSSFLLLKTGVAYLRAVDDQIVVV